jgi:hypothetical protein
MDIQKAVAKFKALTTNKNRGASYIQHLQRQKAKLGRIARLLRVSPDEARECMELIMEYLSSEGILKKGMVKLPRKRIQGNIDNEVKMFLVQNGLCD